MSSNSKQSTADTLRRMLRQNVLKNVEAKAAIPKPVEPLPVNATVAEGHKIGKVPSNAKPETAAQQTVQPQAAAIEQNAPKQGVYSQLYSQLFNNQQPESPEEIAKREKREQTRQRIATLSDSLAHVANIWGTIKGAAPANLSSLSDANRRRYEYANQKRLKNEDAWQRGMFKAQTLDMQNDKQDALFKAQQEAAQRKHDFDVQNAKEENERKDLEFKFKVEEAERKHKLDEEKAKADRDYREGMLEVARTNAATSARRADISAQALQSRTSGTGANKMVQFAMSDGSVVEVPDALKADFYAEMYDYIATTASNQGIELPFFDYKNDMTVSKASHMRDAVHSYYKRVEGGEEKLRELAKRYNNNIENISQSDEGIEDSYDDESDYLTQAIDELVPNM